ncbi:MAG: hypothetical protein RIQ59_281, partial [Bacteroidota bacterium]
MKKIALLLLLFVSTVFYSQTNGITYQAIIYNPSGEVIPGVNNTNAPMANRNVCLQFSIIDELSQTEYQETITTLTDEFGMVNLVIGSGNQTGGYASSFANIYWSVVKKGLKVALDVSGQCGNFVEISNQDFETVPFAFASKSAENVTGVVPVENGGTNATTVIGAKTNLGLENVDNTSDLNKPISIATQAALDLKENLVNKSTDVTIDGTSDIKYPTVKSVKTYVDANSSIGSSALAAEVTRAMAAEATIATNLTTEISRAVNAEATKEDLVNKSSSVVIDGTSDVKYPTVKAVKTYVDANLTAGSNALSAEIVRATNAENAIAANLVTEASTRAASDATLTNNLAAEVTRAIAAEATKEDVINKSTSIVADGTSDIKYASVKSVKTYVDASTTSASNALAQEIAIRAAADTSLSSDITTEAATRTAADLTLTNNIISEASTRAAAVATLTTNINNEVIRATNAEGAITTNLTTEINRAIAAEATKEDVINKSTSIVADGTSDVKYASVKSVKTYVDASATAASTALAAEAATRAAADATLTSDLATEVSTRAAADTTLTTNLSAEASTRASADTTLTTNLAAEVTRATGSENTIAANLTVEVT